MPAPTFVTSGSGASWDTTTSPKTTGGLATNSGDLIISVLADENDDGNENYAWSSSVTETWTEHTESTGATNGAGFLQSARATTTSAWSSGTVSATRSAGGSSKYNHVATVWRSHDGIGNIGNSPETGTTSPSYSFTTAAANSALLVIAVDWNARSGASRTYTQINSQSAVELAYFTNSANYTIYVFYFADVGAAGAKTIQINGLASAGDTIFHVVEVKGAAGGGTTHAISATGTGTSTGSAALSQINSAASTGTGASTGSAALVIQLAISATGTGTSTGSINLLLAPGALSGTGTGETTGSVNLLLAPGAISATGTGQTAGSVNLNQDLTLAATGSGTTTGSVDVTIGATTHALSATGTGATTGSASLVLAPGAFSGTGTGQTAGSANLTATLALSATGTGTTGGSAALAGVLSVSAIGSAMSAGSLSVTLGGSAHALSATGTGATSGSAALRIITGLSATGAGQTSGSLVLNLTGAQLRALGLGGTTTGSLVLNLRHELTATGAGQTSGSLAMRISLHRLESTGYTFSSGSLDLSEPLFRFSMPTHEEPIRYGHDTMRPTPKPLNYYRLTYAPSLVKVNGTWTSMRVPAPELLQGLVDGVDYFRGGFEYEIDQRTARELATAGYSSTPI